MTTRESRDARMNFANIRIEKIEWEIGAQLPSGSKFSTHISISGKVYGSLIVQTESGERSLTIRRNWSIIDEDGDLTMESDLEPEQQKAVRALHRVRNKVDVIMALHARNYLDMRAAA